MLKVLRVVSWAVAVLAVVGVAVFVLLLNYGEREILDFLRRPSIVQRWQIEHPVKANDNRPYPLEQAAAALGRRLKPPVVVVTPVDEKKEDRIESPIGPIKEDKTPTPKPRIFQYQLVGTFVAEDVSARSMALIEVSKGRFEWIEPGQYLGNQRLGDITPRRTALIDGAKRKELVMSPKPPIALPVSDWIIE